ncbi:helix-turn-helix domain-containing protein [Staphylococcus haemolyticus]|uniref:helix-turn-helix domain-containing protein n=1 Tax=Staphylococcus haemolyticus TaxID=1283 RepID=UPI001A94CBE1|nr:helix-turn-helix transcriptional regulator [Staphylococcus haemolyticus]QTK08695.1 helix-turn-helix transcriptional regulator [Staphylococcus haemolyticus]QTK10859.1 helix-turn-helix transcriptional regulator [Staphylococcus haemolyticus]QTK13043.1 helix-turn-helix transcriptional regulator [Staphylococcus haemolyticus]
MAERQNTLGQVIKRIRKSKKMTQQQLSELTGFSQNTISNHENGNRKIDLDDLHTYADSLNTSYNLIVHFSEDLFHNGFSKALDQFQDFQKIYDYVLKAYYTEGDVYFSSIDEYKEALEIVNILKKRGLDISSIKYEYVKDLYIELLNNDKSNNDKLKPITLEEIISFTHEYIEIMSEFNTRDDSFDKNNLVKRAKDLKLKSLKISERIYNYPNYYYQKIKGKPMYLVFKEIYPQNIDELISMINKN